MNGGRCKRRRRWSAAAVALALLLGAGAALAAPADPKATDRRIAELLDLWRCPIAAYFDRILEDLFIDRMEGNEAIFSRVMGDKAFRKAAQEQIAREVYDRIRGQKGADIA